MGQGPSLQDIPLTSPRDPLVVFDSRFCSPSQLRLRMPEKASSFDPLSIKDVNGTTYFQIDGKNFDSSGKKKKTCNDLYGNPIWSMTGSMTATDPQGNTVCSAADGRNGNCVIFHKSTGQVLFVRMKSYEFFTQAALFIGNKEDRICIAKLLPPMCIKDAPVSGYDFFVEIAPGVDASFVLMMFLLYDDLRYRPRGHVLI